MTGNWKVLTCLMSLCEFSDKRGLYTLCRALANWKGALSMVVIDLRVFLDLQVSVCELGAFDYLFESIHYLFGCAVS